MPARVDIPLPELIGLIEEHKGNVSRIGRSIKRHRHTIQARIDESKQAQAALTDARETRVDAVEDAIFDMALGGNITAAIFVLKASPEAKRRGWGDRTELTGKDGGPVEHEHRGQVHGSVEHVAAVVAGLVELGAIALPGTSASDTAENDAIHR